MPKLQDHECHVCSARFEFIHQPADEVAVCPACGATDTELCLSGGHVFTTIVPSHPATQQSKAGYVHKFQNRPAEKISVSVPRTKGDPT